MDQQFEHGANKGHECQSVDLNEEAYGKYETFCTGLELKTCSSNTEHIRRQVEQREVYAAEQRADEAYKLRDRTKVRDEFSR